MTHQRFKKATIPLQKQKTTLFGEDSIEDLLPIGDYTDQAGLETTISRNYNRQGSSQIAKSQNAGRVLTTSTDMRAKSSLDQRFVNFGKFKKVTHFYKKSDLNLKESQEEINLAKLNETQNFIRDYRTNELFHTCYNDENMIDYASSLERREQLPLLYRTREAANKSQFVMGQNEQSLQMTRFSNLDREGKRNLSSSGFFAKDQPQKKLQPYTKALNGTFYEIKPSILQGNESSSTFNEDGRANNSVISFTKTRNFPFYKIGGDSAEKESQPTYPYNKSLVSYELNEKLIDTKGFGSKLNNVVTTVNQVNTDGKHKTEDRLERFDAHFRGKVGLMDSLLNTYMNETQHEFLIKPSPYHTREEIQKYIDIGSKKEKGKKIFSQKGISDFDIIHVHKYQHFTDHRGNFLTKTGHKIDDFSLQQTSHPAIPMKPAIQSNKVEPAHAKANSHYQEILNRQKDKLKAAENEVLISNIKIKSKQKKLPMPTLVEERRPRRASKFNLPKSDDLSFFTQKIGSMGQSQAIPLRGSPHRTSIVHPNQVLVPLSEGDCPVIIKQLDMKVVREDDQFDTQDLEDSDERTENSEDFTEKETNSLYSGNTGTTQQTNLVLNKKKGFQSIWNAIQLKNYSKVKEYSRAKDDQEVALIAFIQKCEQGLQLPFSLINCLKPTNDMLESQKLVLDFKLTEAAAIGTGEAIKILGESLKGVELIKIGCTDLGQSQILQSVRENPQIEELSIIGGTIGQLSTQKIINIIQLIYDSMKIKENTGSPDQLVRLKKLELRDCKFLNKDMERLLSKFIQFDVEGAAGHDMTRGTSFENTPSVTYRSNLMSTQQFSFQFGDKASDQKRLRGFYEFESLTLSKIKIPKIEHLVSLIQHSDTLRHLDLSYNQMKSNEIEQIVEALSFSCVKSLNLSFNHLSDFAFQMLGEFVRFSWNIIDLDISYTGFNNQQKILQFMQEIKRSATLQSLHMNGIPLEEPTLIAIREILGISSQSINRRVVDDNPLNISKESLEVYNQSQQDERDGVSTSTYQEKSSSKLDNKMSTWLQKGNIIQMNERLIFSRILGHPEIQDSQRWKEGEVCWICEKYNYCLFLYQTSEDIQMPSLRSSFTKGQTFQMTRIENFCKTIGCTAQIVSTNWYELLMKHLKYNPYVVLDLKEEDIKLIQQPQWWVYAQFIQSRVTHTLNLEDDTQQFTFQVPKMNQEIKCSFKGNTCRKGSDEEDPKEISQIDQKDLKKLSKEEQRVLSIRSQFPQFRFKDIFIKDGSNAQDTSPVSSKLKMFVQIRQSEDDQLLQKCYDNDYRYSHITSLVENSSQMLRVNEYMARIYHYICDIFIYEISQSELYPQMSFSAFDTFCKKYKLIDDSAAKTDQLKQYLIKDMLKQTVRPEEKLDKTKVKPQRKLLMNNLNLKKASGNLIQVISLLKKAQSESLTRWHLFELLFRIALKNNMQMDSLTAINAFIDQKIIPQWDNLRLCDERMRVHQSIENDLILQIHKDTVKNVFNRLQNLSTVPIARAQEFMIDLFPDRLSNAIIQRCFVLSKRYVVDETEDIERYFSIDTREFYEFLVRLAPYVILEDLPLFYLVDRMMTRISYLLKRNH